MTKSSLRIINLGYVVRGPLGGLAWHHLQYIMGLTDLGHDVYFFEDSEDFPSCYDPAQGKMTTDPTYGLRFAEQAFTRIGLADRWAFYDAHTSTWHGPCAAQATNLCATADVALNISGVNPIRPWLADIPVRALVDTDPAFTQIRHLAEPAARDLALNHTVFLSFGENIAQPGCSIPDDGFPWKPTRQPIVLDAWPVTPVLEQAPFTTVMQWDSYKQRLHEGRVYGMKSLSFEPFLDLPRWTGSPLELALGSKKAPWDMLLDKGWSLRAPLEVTRDPWTYQRYIQESKGEFSVAKHGYVVSDSGWFSERSAAYLASGRPVVVQETGFSRWMETGAGVVAFRTLEEAEAGLAAVTSSYAAHSAAAREVAAAYFDHRVVLARLIEQVMTSASVAGQPVINPDGQDE